MKNLPNNEFVNESSPFVCAKFEPSTREYLYIYIYIICTCFTGIIFAWKDNYREADTKICK